MYLQCNAHLYVANVKSSVKLGLTPKDLAEDLMILPWLFDPHRRTLRGVYR